MKSVAELFQDKNYELLARTYFDWLAKELGNGDFETGLIGLTQLYNDWVFANRPIVTIVIPTAYQPRIWFSENKAVSVTNDDLEQFNLCFETELKTRIEEELHHSNPLNP